MLPDQPILQAAEKVSLTISSLIIPDRLVGEGVLIKSASSVWFEIVERLRADWTIAYQLTSRQWEELIAGAFERQKFDEVVLTPRSGDHGRDVIAIKHGFGSVKIIGSVKANAPGNLVPYDDVRALMGVMSSERDVSKGIITTTSDFPPNIETEPFIAPLLPTRLELINAKGLQKLLDELAAPQT